MAGNMDSEHLLKFIGYFPDYLSALSRTLLCFFWTTFIETAVFRNRETRFILRPVYDTLFLVLKARWAKGGEYWTITVHDRGGKPVVRHHVI